MEEYQAELLQRQQPSSTKQARILVEHAEFLKALTTIDNLLDKMQHVVTFEGAMTLASQMDDAIPESIVVTRRA